MLVWWRPPIFPFQVHFHSSSSMHVLSEFWSQSANYLHLLQGHCLVLSFVNQICYKRQVGVDVIWHVVFKRGGRGAKVTWNLWLVDAVCSTIITFTNLTTLQWNDAFYVLSQHRTTPIQGSTRWNLGYWCDGGVWRYTLLCQAVRNRTGQCLVAPSTFFSSSCGFCPFYTTSLQTRRRN